MFIFAHLYSYSLRRTKLLGTPIRMRVYQEEKERARWEGGGGRGAGKGTGNSHGTADR